MATETFTVTSSGKPKIIKDPDAHLDYTWDWTDWLDLIEDTIDSFTVTAETEVSIDSQTLDATEKMVTAVIGGGAVGTKYSVVCHIETVGGRIDDRAIILQIKER